MKLVMFSPKDVVLERGWPGRLEGDRVVQLAAQTLQAFFSGGGQAREHAVYPLADVVFRAPVLHPPSVRIFDGDDFVFSNPAAIRSPGDRVPLPKGAAEIVAVERTAAIVDSDGRIAGFTPLAEWTAPALPGTKSRDFALVLGPVVTTPDEGVPATADWERMLEIAAANTTLHSGDLLVA